MDKEDLIKYAPVALVVIALILQYNLFVTPEKLEKTHREIMNEVSLVYLTKEHYKEQHDDLKAQLNDMQHKLDKMYEVIMGGRR